MRGTNLLDSTPSYCYIAIIVDEQNHKLSKQSFAKPVDNLDTSQTLPKLLGLLNHSPPKELSGISASQLIDWAIIHWQPEKPHQIVSLRI